MRRTLPALVAAAAPALAAQRSLALDPNQEVVRRGLADLDRGGKTPQ